MTPFPTVMQPVTIDGRTQPGYAGKPIIEINGALLDDFSTGLTLNNADVHGLVVSHFTWAGISIVKGTIRNCYIGTDITGTLAKPNSRGIRAMDTVVIGGDGANEGNLISGNYTGVQVYGYGITNVSIQGNTFGTNASRTALIESSVHVSVDNAEHGGTCTIGDVAPNVFAGGSVGVDVFYSDNVRIEKNYFGRTGPPSPSPPSSPSTSRARTRSAETSSRETCTASSLPAPRCGTASPETRCTATASASTSPTSTRTARRRRTTPSTRRSGAESHVVRVPELPAGPASVTLNDALARVTTSGPLFSVLEARPPRIIGVSPPSVAAGAELELTGDGFRPGYTFEIGGQTAAIVSLDYTRAVVRVSPRAGTGMQAVQVHNRAGVLAALGPNVEIAGTGLVVTSADPRCALTDGGVYAPLRGRGLTSVAAVAFDGVPSAEVLVVDDTTLRALVPPGAAGSARVTVTGDDGASATLTNGFTYASPFDPRGCGGREAAFFHPRISHKNPTSRRCSGPTLGVNSLSGETMRFLFLLFLAALPLSAAAQTPGAFSFETASTYGYEDSRVIVTVWRLGGADGAASVSYAVRGGTATAADFSGGTGTLAFADGETRKTFTIQTIDDALYEGTETIELGLSDATNGTSIGSPATAAVTIYDDDPEPRASIESMRIAEGNSGTTVVQVPMTLSAPAAVPYTVPYTIDSWNATPGTDFIATSGSVTFAPGETAGHVPVTILGDPRWEQDERVDVSLDRYPWDYATVTILNDDPLPTVTAEDLRIQEGNARSTASVTIRAPYPVTGWVFVRLAGGSAQPSSDFETRSDHLYFAGQSSKTFAVTILGDEEPEPNETFTVEVVSLSSSLKAGKKGVVTLVNDDVGVGPAERWIAAGASETFIVRLGERITEEARIGLTSSDPSAVSVPATLVIPAGRESAELDVTALVPGRNVDITLAFPPGLGGATRSVRAHTYAKATLRFSPSRLTVFDGRTATVSVSLDPPSATVTTLGVRSSDRVDVPRSLTIPPGGSAPLLVTAAKIGSFTIDLRLPPVHGNELQSLYGDVIVEPQTPTILSLAPSHGPASGGTEVLVQGANLRAGCTVLFGGVPAASAKVANATAMTAATPPHAPGSVDVLLRCGSDSFLFPDGFGYVSEAPRVTNVSPSTGTTDGGTHVRAEGADFDGSCWLFLGDLAATQVVVRGPQSITGVAPPRAAGAADVTVRCSGGTSTLSQAFTYRGEDDPAPLIEEIIPPAAAPGELVTVRGRHFRPTDHAAVDTPSVVEATPAAIVDSAPESHVIQVPELPAGSASIFVRDIFGRTTTSGPMFSVLEARPPRITAVAPASAAAGGELELTGEGFRSGYTFEIGGQPAAIVSIEYERAVVRVAAQVGPGSQPVHVRNSAGVLAAIGPDVDIVDGGMIVESADPRCTTTDGGVYAVIRGRGFAGSPAVAFDGVPSPEVVAIDGTTMRVAVPSGAAGPATISVTDGSGRTATLTDGFRYASPFDPDGCGRRARRIRP